MQSIKDALQDCHTDVLFIPNGMTYLLQPCDVYLNKPFKGEVRRLWEQFMQNQAPGNFSYLYLIYNLE